MQAQATSSLYERLGGEEAVMAAVNLFYSRVLVDPLLAPFFEGLDMEQQTRKQVAFMTRAFDGPVEYHGRDLTTAHAALVASGMGDEHFDAVALHLKEALEELEVDPADIAEVMTIVGSTRSAVLGRIGRSAGA